MQQQMVDPTSLAIRPALHKSKQQTGDYSTSVFQLKRKSVEEQARAYRPSAPESYLMKDTTTSVVASM